ncbi:MAG: gamma-glutamylcyclotransferase family protein [Gammaproteobacteria bacterium]
MDGCVFAYGTLIFGELMEALTGSRWPAEPARLPGYARYRMRGQPYPGIVPAPGASVDGVLYRGLSPLALELIHRFEADLYDRIAVQVHCIGGLARAAVYVVPEHRLDQVDDAPWSTEGFAARGLARYVRGCRSFRAAELRSIGAA